MALLKEVLNLLTPEQSNRALLVIFFMFIGMALEMFGIGLILPDITIFLDADTIRGYFDFEAYSDFQIIAFFLSLLMLAFLIKTFYLLFLAWRQSSFSFRIGAEIAED